MARDTARTMSQENVEIVRGRYGRIGTGRDVDAALTVTSSEDVIVIPRGLAGRPMHGREAA